MDRKVTPPKDHLAQVPPHPQVHGNSDSEEHTDSLPDEFDFVEQPLAGFFCPMTSKLLLEPHQTACCGNHLSQRVVSVLKREGKPCPICKEPNLVTELDKSLRHRVRAVQVHCPDGCKWVGEVRELNQHLQTCLLHIIKGICNDN